MGTDLYTQVKMTIFDLDQDRSSDISCLFKPLISGGVLEED